MARLCDHCGKAFADGSNHICEPVHFESLGKGLAGKREVKLTEGTKYDKGKPDHSLIPPDALEDVVRVYDLGVSKYGRDNWRKGILYSRIFAAIMRHLWAWWRGADRNEEDGGVRHLAQAAWGCLTLLEYSYKDQYHQFDDRFYNREWKPIDEVYDFKQNH